MKPMLSIKNTARTNGISSFCIYAMQLYGRHDVMWDRTSSTKMSLSYQVIVGIVVLKKGHVLLTNVNASSSKM